MPFTYSTEFLNSTGMVSVQRFQLHRDGRRVMFFTNDDNNDLFKRIFVHIDGMLTEFKNGSRMDTPIGIGGTLFSAPHDSYAILIDTRPYSISDITIPITPVTITFPHGRQASINFSGKLRASVSAKNPEDLAHAFVNGLASPIQTAEAIFKESFREAVINELPELIKSNPLQTINTVDFLSIRLKKIIKSSVEHELSWCRVDTCEVIVSIDNIEELVAHSNEIYVLTMETKVNLLNAIIKTFGTSPLSPEVSKIIGKFVIANPGLSSSEYINFCENVQKQFAVTNASDIINITRQLGILPSLSGNNLMGGN